MADGSDDPRDRELARRARGGCREAFRALVLAHQRGVLNLLRRRLPNHADAEDVAQDTFLRAWRGLDRYRDRWQFRTWLYAIAIRAAVDRLRAQARLPQGAPHDVADEARADPARVAESGEAARNLWELADRLLPADQRTALWLRYVEGLDTGEIAASLGRTGLAVRLLLMRGRRRLAAHLAEADRIPVAAAAAYHDPSAPARCGVEPHD